MTVREPLARGGDIDDVVEMPVGGHGAPRPRDLDVPTRHLQLVGEEGDVTGRGIVGAEEVQNPTSHRGLSGLWTGPPGRGARRRGAGPTHFRPGPSSSWRVRPRGRCRR